MEKIISGYHIHNIPIMSSLHIVKLMGLIALQADIGIDDHYESDMYYCRFSEDVSLATSSSRQYICQNASVGAIMLPLENANEEFQVQYSVIYSDWDDLKSNGDKGLHHIPYDLFLIYYLLIMINNFS